jgi:hypothetical protein
MLTRSSSKLKHTPDNLFAAAELCRAFDWTVPLYNHIPVDHNLRFFEQVPVGQYDVIGISR